MGGSCGFTAVIKKVHLLSQSGITDIPADQLDSVVVENILVFANDLQLLGSKGHKILGVDVEEEDTQQQNNNDNDPYNGLQHGF